MWLNEAFGFGNVHEGKDKQKGKECEGSKEGEITSVSISMIRNR